MQTDIHTDIERDIQITETLIALLCSPITGEVTIMTTRTSLEAESLVLVEAALHCVQSIQHLLLDGHVCTQLAHLSTNTSHWHTSSADDSHQPIIMTPALRGHFEIVQFARLSVCHMVQLRRI